MSNRPVIRSSVYLTKRPIVSSYTRQGQRTVRTAVDAIGSCELCMHFALTRPSEDPIAVCY